MICLLDVVLSNEVIARLSEHVDNTENAENTRNKSESAKPHKQAKQYFAKYASQLIKFIKANFAGSAAVVEEGVVAPPVAAGDASEGVFNPLLND